LTISVSADDEAMAEPQPKVWKCGVEDDLGFRLDLEHQAQRIAALP
jgi:hypothetical protein